MSTLTVIKQGAFDYHAEDSTDGRFSIAGGVGGGILKFVVIAQLPDGTRGTLSGSQFFDAMMSHFVQAGTAVKIIEGEWADNPPELRTNLDVFNQLIAAGQPPVDAALRTPTGKFAAKHGYGKATIVHALPAGGKGNYRDVLVHFTQ